MSSAIHSIGTDITSPRGKEIVLARGGDLTAANDEAGGAMFTIELPYQPNYG